MNSTESLPTPKNPKLFVSYSWSSPQHEQWVLQLATELRESSVDVILDKWDLKEGHDANAFMEKMVTDAEIKKVILVCDRKYSEKADKRSGGVGTEAQIISPEIYQRADQEKFVAVIVEKDDKGQPYLPTYYKSRVYIDFSDSDQYAKSFEQLLRWVFDKPIYVKPDLGSKPAFLEETSAISLGIGSRYSRSMEAIRNSRSYAIGALEEYFNTFVANLENFRIAGSGPEFPDKVVENVELFLPYRNEAVQLFSALAQYNNTGAQTQLHGFFEKLIPYLSRPEDVLNYRVWDFDNFRFIVHELFLYCIAVLLKYGTFNAVASLLDYRYYIGNNPDSGTDLMQSFVVFCPHLKSLVYKQERLSPRRLSLRAEMLKGRSTGSGVGFEQLMQADFVLFVRASIEKVKGISNQQWWPETLLYMANKERAFEIFARAESTRYFESLRPVLGVGRKEELQPMVEAFQAGKLNMISWEHLTVDPLVLLNYEKLATRV